MPGLLSYGKNVPAAKRVLQQASSVGNVCCSNNRKFVMFPLSGCALLRQTACLLGSSQPVLAMLLVFQIGESH